MRYLSASALFLAAAAAPILQAQSAPPPPEPQDEVIHMDVRRVVLYATVRDSRNHYVDNLSQSDFALRLDGKPVHISGFSHADVPVAIGLVIDASGSMVDKKKEVIAAALGFIRASNPQDETFVVFFNDVITFPQQGDHEFTNSISELEKALERLNTVGQTAMYDGIYAALDQLKKSHISKKVLVVISDGADNRSMKSSAQVVRAASDSGAVVYCIGIYDRDDQEAQPSVLRRLAHDTGGESFFPIKLDEVGTVCRSIAHDIRNQYILEFTPPETANDTAYHQIQLSARVPGQGALKVRTRAGYFGPDAPNPGEQNKKK
jgi:Ca-activated chloride channel homolog